MSSRIWRRINETLFKNEFTSPNTPLKQTSQNLQELKLIHWKTTTQQINWANMSTWHAPREMSTKSTRMLPLRKLMESESLHNYQILKGWSNGCNEDEYISFSRSTADREFCCIPGYKTWERIEIMRIILKGNELQVFNAIRGSKDNWNGKGILVSKINNRMFHLLLFTEVT